MPLLPFTILLVGSNPHLIKMVRLSLTYGVIIKTMHAKSNGELREKLKSAIPFKVIFQKHFPDHYREYGNSRCPHEKNHHNGDRNPSYTIYDNHGFCHACQSNDDIFSIQQLATGEDFPTAMKNLAREHNIPIPSFTRKGNSKAKTGFKNLKPIEGRTYTYLDANGQNYDQDRIYRNTSTGTKEARPWHWDGQEWKIGRGPQRGEPGYRPRILYNLPALMASSSDAVIHIVEGCKDAENLIQSGLLATTAGSSSVWNSLVKDDGHLALKGHTLVIFEDNDEPGRKNTKAICQTMHKLVPEIRIVRFTEMPEKSDVTDFLEQATKEHGAEQAKALLLERIQKAEVYTYVETEIKESASKAHEFGFTDLGNSRRLAEHLRGKLKYADNKWWFYNKQTGLWNQDDNHQALALCKNELPALLYAEAQRTTIEDDARKRVAKFGVSCEGRGKIRNAMELLVAEQGIATTIGDFDRNSTLIACKNGVIDLTNYSLKPHSPDYLLTKRLGCKFEPTAMAPRFEKFLEEIFSENTELISFIQRALGYSILEDHNSEQCWFLCWGRGSNGKTTLLELIKKISGSYSCSVSPATFQQQRPGTPRQDLASLVGIRFLPCPEFPSSHIDGDLIKTFCGGDTLRVRKLYGNEFDFRPAATLWLSSNTKPQVNDRSEGFWRRVRLIPFENRFETPDKNLPAILFAEAPGILNWIIVGHQQWKVSGLEPTPSICVEAQKNYREDSDPLADFLCQCCLLHPLARVSVGSLHEQYLRFCEQNGVRRPWGKQRFNAELESAGDLKRGLVREREKRFQGWIGIGLRGPENVDRLPIDPCENKCERSEVCPRLREKRDPNTCKNLQTLY